MLEPSNLPDAYRVASLPAKNRADEAQNPYNFSAHLASVPLNDFLGDFAHEVKVLIAEGTSSGFARMSSGFARMSSVPPIGVEVESSDARNGGRRGGRHLYPGVRAMPVRRFKLRYMGNKRIETT